jgi:hypothetical protein
MISKTRKPTFCCCEPNETQENARPLINEKKDLFLKKLHLLIHHEQDYTEEFTSILNHIKNKQLETAKKQIDEILEILPSSIKLLLELDLKELMEDILSIEIFEKYLQKHETNPLIESFYYITVLFDLYQKCRIHSFIMVQMLETYFFPVVNKYSKRDLVKKIQQDAHLRMLVEKITDYATDNHLSDFSIRLKKIN